MVASRIKRLLSLPVAVLLSLALPGCQPVNMFYGRLVVINATGEHIGEPVVSNDLGGDNIQKFPFPDMPDGQAWVRSSEGGAMMVIFGPLKLSFVDRKGILQTLSVPFERQVPQPCYEDYFIEIGPRNTLRSGLLLYQEHDDTSLVAYALTFAAGLAIGCLIWRRGRRDAAWPDRDEKRIFDPEMA